MELYQVDVGVVTRGNHKHARSCRESSVEEPEGAQVGRFSEIEAGICDVHGLTDHQRKNQPVE